MFLYPTATHTADAPEPKLRAIAPDAGVLGPRTGGRAPEIEIKLGAADGFGFSVVEQHIPPKFSPPPVMHRQTRESVAVYILEGELRYWWTDGDTVATPGTLMQIPRLGWWRWANEQDVACRALAIFAPAGFEHYFIELGAAAAAAQGDPAVLGREIPKLRARYGDEEASA